MKEKPWTINLKMKTGTKILITVICLLFAYFLVLSILSRFIFLESVDVAKRIESPDRTKTALLIRRHAFIDLNFYLKIKSEYLFSKTLHKSKDFLPDPSVDWNEQLTWSKDSSFLVMSVDNPFDNIEKYMWAYDFKDHKEYTDETVIMEILNSRNEGKENPIEQRYK